MFLDTDVVTCTGKNIIYNHRLVGRRIWPNQAGLKDWCQIIYIILFYLNFSQTACNNLPHTTTAGLNCGRSVSFMLMETVWVILFSRSGWDGSLSGRCKTFLSHLTDAMSFSHLLFPLQNMVIITFLYFSSLFYFQATRAARSSLLRQSFLCFNMLESPVSLRTWPTWIWFNSPSGVALTKGSRRKGLAALCPLTKEMFWRSWCCHENADTLDWHTESLRPCWCKRSRGCSCAAGSNTRPHLEEQTAGRDWQAWRETSAATSLFPGYHHDNHGVLWCKSFFF